MIVGSDFDGTWTRHPEIWGKVDLIITGRSWEEYEDFKDLKEGPDVPVFFGEYGIDQKDRVTRAKHKADVINKIEVTDYYEDDPVDAEVLRILCPYTEIHMVVDQYTSL